METKDTLTGSVETNLKLLSEVKNQLSSLSGNLQSVMAIYLPNQLESCDARCETSLPEIGIRNLVDKEHSQILSIMSLIEDLKYIVNKI